MNAPDRFDQHVLAEGESPYVLFPFLAQSQAHNPRRVTLEEDTKIPNAVTLTINKEDHTLAGLLRSQLLLNPRVLFAGYQLAHPLEPRFTLKIQTDSPDYPPVKAVEEAIRTALAILAKLREQVMLEAVRAKAMAEDPLAPGGQVSYGAGDEPLGMMEPTYAEF